MNETLYLIDAHALAFRAYYAFIRQPLFTTGGENTSALFGFMRMILKLMRDESFRYLACVFDSRKKTFRYELYPQYKANRVKTPQDLLSQIEIIKETTSKLGIPVIEIEGYEADDVIGTISTLSSRQGMRTVIVSGDKDILQLVNDNITVYAPKKGITEIEVMDGKKVVELWGVEPEKMVDLLALMGDHSDNIPGVKGIGEVWAVKLIRQFGSLENLYRNINLVEKERIRKNLIQGKEEAFLSRELVVIKRDAPLDFKPELLNIQDFPGKEGLSILKQKEMNTIVAELEGKTDVNSIMVEKKRGNYHLIDSMEQFSELKKRIKEKRFISLDTESTGLDPFKASLIGVSISLKEGEGYYIPVISRQGKAVGEKLIKTELKEILEDPKIKKIGQNLKYDFTLLLCHGVYLKGIEGDTMVAAYLLNPQKQRYSLDEMAREFLGYNTIRYGDVVKNKGETLLDYPLQKVVEYAGEDSDIALRLHNVLERKLREENLISLYCDLEVPLIEVLGKMEYTGVRVDQEYLREMSRQFGKELEEIEVQIFQITGGVFNVRSTKQLSTVLFERMNLPEIKKTKTGLSTDESVLEELSGQHEIARLLLRHRRLSKLKSTYIDALPQMINIKTGRIHTFFNQTITTTGRLSSSNPNLQNIPIKEKEGRAIRRSFVPPQGWLFVSADYSQIELRVLASLSKDKALMDTFRKDGDIHRETASILFGVEPHRVQDYQRSLAKTINFSIIYGISPFGLSRRLGISQGEASRFIDMYFSRYSGVKSYFENVVKNASERGYVETLLGRRRYIPEINSENQTLFQAARRTAINTPVQGTAADLIKKAMLDIHREIIRRGMESKMIIQVHDELVFECPQEEFELLSALVREKMEHALEFEVPLKVNISAGKNWEEAH